MSTNELTAGTRIALKGHLLTTGTVITTDATCWNMSCTRRIPAITVEWDNAPNSLPRGPRENIQARHLVTI